MLSGLSELGQAYLSILNVYSIAYGLSGALLGNGWYRGYLAWEGQRNVYGDRLALLCQIEVTYKDQLWDRQYIVAALPRTPTDADLPANLERSADSLVDALSEHIGRRLRGALDVDVQHGSQLLLRRRERLLELVRALHPHRLAAQSLGHRDMVDAVARDLVAVDVVEGEIGRAHV